MTRSGKTWLAGIWTLLTLLDTFIVQQTFRTSKWLMYQVGGPFWMALFEWIEASDGNGLLMNETFWAVLTLVQLGGYLLGTLLCGFRQYWLFLGTLTVSLLTRAAWIVWQWDEPLHYIFSFVVYAGVYAVLLRTFVRRDADAPAARVKKSGKAA